MCPPVTTQYFSLASSNQQQTRTLANASNSIKSIFMVSETNVSRAGLMKMIYFSIASGLQMHEKNKSFTINQTNETTHG